jgi:uncharacterized membrane protein
LRGFIVLRRMGATAALVLVVLGGAAGLPGPAAAQSGLSITTPFPAVSVQPGESVSFDLTVSADEPSRVDLSLQSLPDGWSGSMSGGGNEVQGAFVDAGAPATVTLALRVPDDAEAGAVPITVVGQSGGTTARLELDLTIAEAGGGTVSLESDYPSLRGTVDTDFKFNLTLHNDTPGELTFALQADGPDGWDVTIQPTGETRAASVTVAARATQRLEVSATPGAQASAETYPIDVTVTAGDQQATAQLGVEITGSVAMQLTTPDERLNTTANAGSATDFTVVIVNNGTSPLTAVDLAGAGPTDWAITFDPTTVDQIDPGTSAPATAHITPSSNAVAGDYQISLSATNADANESLDVRVTVETAPIWGIVGILLVVGTIGAMVLVFRRYGRR